MLKKTYRSRLKTLHLVPVAALCVLLPKLIHLQVLKRDYYLERADVQHNATNRMAPTRGKILDSRGRELAGSVMMSIAYVNPRLMGTPPEAGTFTSSGPDADPTSRTRAIAREIAALSKGDYDAIYQALTRKGSSGKLALSSKVPVDLDAKARDGVKALFDRFRKEIPARALWFEEVSRRRYARDDLAAQVIGYTVENETGDNFGMQGVERQYDAELKGESIRFRARTNAMQNLMEPAPESLVNSTFGHTVVLTINETIQDAVEKALADVVLRHNADSAVGIVYEVKTGRVLGMSSVPTYRLSDHKMVGEAQKRNRVIANSIEPGSVMKIFSFASLFEQGKGTPDDIIDCGGSSFAIAGRVIRDVHGVGSAPIRKIFEQSSNIGTIKAAMRLSPGKFRQQLVKFGFGDVTGIDLPGEAPGKLRPLARWSGQSMSSLPMGYELTVSAIQVAAACGALGNQGWYMQPHVVQEIRDARGQVIRKVEPQVLRQVVKPETCRMMLDIMEQVVEKGTGKPAQIPGYRLGGKTGTTKKVDPETKRYTMRNYIASFCGLAPINDPEVCIYVYVDNPRGGDFYGGKVAAPVFRDIAEPTLKELRIQPGGAPRPLTPAEVKAGIKQPSAPPPTTPMVAMQQVKTTLRDRVPLTYLERTAKRDTATTGAMPNLEGLTMKEVTDVLVGRGLKFEFLGTGVALEQEPKAYELLESGTTVHVTFGPERQLLARVAMIARESSSVSEADQFSQDDAEDVLASAAARDLGVSPATQTPETASSGSLVESPASAAALSFSRNDGRELRLPLKEPASGQDSAVQHAPLVSGAAPARHVQPEPLVDADPHARKTVDSSSAKTAWAEFAKELARKKAEAEKAAKAAATVAEGDTAKADQSEAAAGSNTKARKSSGRNSSRTATRKAQ